MSSKGYRWFNNGVEEACLKECPFGWSSGRLKMSEETRRKMSQSSWTRRASKEELRARNERIKTTKRNKSDEEKSEYAKHVSEARKGKGIGNSPWNKGKTGFVAHNKGKSMSEEQKIKLRDRYRSLSNEEKKERALKVSKSNKGRKAWNKGVKCPLSKTEIARRKAKEHETRKRNGSYTHSIVEDRCYDFLTDVLCLDVQRQYSDDRYPFDCDFHTSDDKFIEINGNWTHCDHQYDIESDEDNRILEQWVRKSDSDYYKNAIYTWTDLDVRKKKTAKKNNLDYVVVYPSNTLEYNLRINDRKNHDLVEALYNCCQSVKY